MIDEKSTSCPNCFSKVGVLKDDIGGQKTRLEPKNMPLKLVTCLRAELEDDWINFSSPSKHHIVDSSE